MICSCHRYGILPKTLYIATVERCSKWRIIVVTITSGGKSEGKGGSILLRLQEDCFVTVVMALMLWLEKYGFVGPKVSEDCLVGV
jgi:hypothetical protein